MKSYKTSIVNAIKEHTGAKRVNFVPQLDGVGTAYFNFNQNKAFKIFWIYNEKQNLKEAVDCFSVKNEKHTKYIYEVKV